MTSMDKNQLLAIIDSSLLEKEYGDIERASIQGDAKLAGFILGACFIDAMAGFYCGINKEEAKYNSGKRFKDFVSRYLTQYDAETLYIDLRCGLVHSYAEGGSYVFTDANKGGSHFKMTPKGKTILNLEDFLKDLKDAYRKWRDDVIKNDNLFKNAMKRYKSMGLMGLVLTKHT